MPFQDLHQHSARAHSDQRCVGQENEDPEIQLSRHHHLEPLGAESQGDERLRRRRAPQHDLCERWPRLHPGDPDAPPGVRS